MLGYWIVPSCWGLGFATEAGRAVIALARNSLRIERITGRHFIDNPGSGRVLEKLGFTREDGTEFLFSTARGGTAPAQRYTLDLTPMALAA